MKPRTSFVHTFINLTLFLAISCIGISCSSNAKSKTYDIEKFHTSSAITTNISINGQAFQPQTTEAFLKTQGGKIVLTLASYTDNEGAYFEIKTQQLENLRGKHFLGNNRNRVFYNLEDSTAIHTYYSNYCTNNEGQITIERFDKEKNIISGTLNAKVCTPQTDTQHHVAIQFYDIKVVNL